MNRTDAQACLTRAVIAAVNADLSELEIQDALEHGFRDAGKLGAADAASHGIISMDCALSYFGRRR